MRSTTWLTALRADNVDEAIRIAGLPDRVRGYEGLKLRRAEAYRSELERSLIAWRD